LNDFSGQEVEIFAECARLVENRFRIAEELVDGKKRGWKCGFGWSEVELGWYKGELFEVAEAL